MGTLSVSQMLPRPLLPPIWRELAGLARPPLPAPPRCGRGTPVVLVPGFLAGDGSLRDAMDALRAAGHEPHAVGIRWNVGCSEAAVRRLTATVEALVERDGRRVALVGHSRGGLFARVLARRRPELVSSVVTLGSPHRDQLAVHPLVWMSAATLATAALLHVPGVLRWSCAGAGCCEEFVRDLAAPVPSGVGVLSVYSRRDGVVDWRACVDPAGRGLEAATTHCGMVAHAPTLWAVAAAISDFAA
jgi:pimeloyl-ACP methyl ester carboxylesterase